MRTLICICFAAAAWQLYAQGELFAPEGSYAGELPHRANPDFVFRASIGDFTEGLLKMQLVAQDVATSDDVITLRVPAERRNRVVKARFPFGGRYLGRYNAGRNVIVGHFAGFSRKGRPSVPRERFEMSSVNTNAVTVASLPAN